MLPADEHTAGTKKALRHPSHPRNMPCNYAKGRFSEKRWKSDKVRIYFVGYEFVILYFCVV